MTVKNFFRAGHAVKPSFKASEIEEQIDQSISEENELDRWKYHEYDNKSPSYSAVPLMVGIVFLLHAEVCLCAAMDRKPFVAWHSSKTFSHKTRRCEQHPGTGCSRAVGDRSPATVPLSTAIWPLTPRVCPLASCREPEYFPSRLKHCLKYLWCWEVSSFVSLCHQIWKPDCLQRLKSNVTDKCWHKPSTQAPECLFSQFLQSYGAGFVFLSLSFAE